MDNERSVAWTAAQNTPSIGVIEPLHGERATMGNGIVDSPERVDVMRARAVKLGGADESPAGLRFGNFYAAYFRDLDGDKLNAFCMKS